jgi:hypothetical protein
MRQPFINGAREAVLELFGLRGTYALGGVVGETSRRLTCRQVPVGERGSHGIVETEGGAVSSAGVCAAVAVSLLDGSAVLDFTKPLSIRFRGRRVTGLGIVETEGGAISSAGVCAAAVCAGAAVSLLVCCSNLFGRLSMRLSGLVTFRGVTVGAASDARARPSHSLTVANWLAVSVVPAASAASTAFLRPAL